MYSILSINALGASRVYQQTPIRFSSSMPAVAWHKVAIGQSVKGKPIELFSSAPLYKEGKPVAIDTLIIGGTHGDEIGATKVTEAIKQFLKAPQLRGRVVAIVPQLNPDGIEANTRGNAHQVDLNRNFPDGWQPAAKKDNPLYNPGAAPASEPETQALVKLFNQHDIKRVITLHQPYECVNYDGPAQGLATQIHAITGYPLKPSIGYPTPGSFGTFVGIKRNIPVITLELPHGQLSQSHPELKTQPPTEMNASDTAKVCKAMLAAIQF